MENRSWRTTFRGRFYIHSSQKNFPDFDFIAEQSRAIDHIGEDHKFHRSAIIGEVDIIDCVKGHQSIWAIEKDDKGKEQWHWVLANPVNYDQPILNVNGGLSFWQPSKCNNVKMRYT